MLLVSNHQTKFTLGKPRSSSKQPVGSNVGVNEGAWILAIHNLVDGRKRVGLGGEGLVVAERCGLGGGCGTRRVCGAVGFCEVVGTEVFNA